MTALALIGEDEFRVTSGETEFGDVEHSSRRCTVAGGNPQRTRVYLSGETTFPYGAGALTAGQGWARQYRDAIDYLVDPSPQLGPYSLGIALGSLSYPTGTQYRSLEHISVFDMHFAPFVLTTIADIEPAGESTKLDQREEESLYEWFKFERVLKRVAAAVSETYRDLAIDRIRSLRQASLDGDPEQAPLSLESVESFAIFAERMRTLQRPTFVTSYTGNLVAEWYTSRTHKASVEFRPDRSASYFVVAADAVRPQRLNKTIGNRSVEQLGDALREAGIIVAQGLPGERRRAPAR